MSLFYLHKGITCSSFDKQMRTHKFCFSEESSQEPVEKEIRVSGTSTLVFGQPFTDHFYVESMTRKELSLPISRQFESKRRPTGKTRFGPYLPS